MIGVLMSSTLPARLGEPARALVVARRTGRPRENFPIVLGTLVSQTLMNLLALAILAAIMFSSVDFFSGHQSALIAVAVAPAALLAFLLLAPIVLRHGSVANAVQPCSPGAGPGDRTAAPAFRPGCSCSGIPGAA